MRALGVVIHTGRKMSGFLAETKPPPFKFIPLQITWKRERLYNNINYRVDYMLKKGLLDEVKMIYNKWGESAPVFEGVGYKEMLSFIKGGISLPEATERIKKNTRNYARRQLIWWRKRKTVKLEGEKFVEEGVL